MTQEKAKKIANELDALFEEMVDSLTLEDINGHYRSLLRAYKNELKHNAPYALAPEKIAALEKAVEQFEAVYEAEKAEAEKMPLSRHEAEHLRKLFDKAFNREPFDDARSEH